MVFFSCRISPRASTVMRVDKSPLATAVVTSAMLRTWLVRLPAIELTESVRSFHTPATPFTSAWPPSRPSVPTSRATRVTSAANELSWSTIVLMVFFSSRISPRASTVIRVVKSPFATAVVTPAMLRTWLVRLLAIELTLSVKSFHVPATPVTTAWPPSLPSVPTSRATRVTSLANEFNCCTMVFTTRAVCRNSPRSGRPSTSSDMVCDRSPLATAPITRATSVDGCTRSPIRLFTDLHAIGPRASHRADRSALGDFPVLAHRPADALEFADHLLVDLQNVVQRVGDLAFQVGLVHRHANREIPSLEGDQRAQQHVGIAAGLRSIGCGLNRMAALAALGLAALVLASHGPCFHSTLRGRTRIARLGAVLNTHTSHLSLPRESKIPYGTLCLITVFP